MRAFGREATTFAGVSAQNISIVRDGIQVQDNRYPNGINSVTTINPDLVGEIRLILTPVDVEIGRGNGTIQYSTRSGTNRYTGTAVWSFRNTALDPNTLGKQPQSDAAARSPGGTVPVADSAATGRTSTRARSASAVRSSATRRSSSVCLTSTRIDHAH